MKETKRGEIVRPDAVAAYILAGGRSRRMGEPKSDLLLNGEPIVRQIATRIRAHVGSVHLVMKTSAPSVVHGLPVVYDQEVDTALVHGIRAALAAPGPAWRWVLACDMPLVDASVLHGLWLAAQAMDAPGACVRLSGRDDPDPLPSLWHQDVLHRIDLEWGLVARDWLRHAGLAVWDVPATQVAAFENLNTQAALTDFRRRCEGARP